MATSKNTSFTFAAVCFILSFVGYAALLLLNGYEDDTSVVLFYISAFSAALSAVLCVVTLRGKNSRKSLTILMLIINFVILITYGWMYASKWMLEQSVNEMMNAH